MSKSLITEMAPGPFVRDDFKIVDANGRKIATLCMSSRIPTASLESLGDLLASSWSLQGYLQHVLMCSGTPDDCEHCKQASEMVNE